jgi:hypothetical protein
MLRGCVKFNFVIVGHIIDEPNIEKSGTGIYIFKGSVPDNCISIIQSKLHSNYIVEYKNIQLVDRHKIILTDLEYQQITGDFVWDTADFTYEESDTECFMRYKKHHTFDTGLTTQECVRDTLIALGAFGLSGYLFRLLLRR